MWRVDADTLAIRPLRAVSVVEIGRAIHPVLAAGQVEGGLVQALGLGARARNCRSRTAAT